jgi:hypothetical protein
VRNVRIICLGLQRYENHHRHLVSRIRHFWKMNCFLCEKTWKNARRYD